MNVAKTWFLNHKTEMISWEEVFSLRFREVFRRSEPLKAGTLQNLLMRPQLASETYTSYIEDVLSLCQHVDACRHKSERIQHIIKGVAGEAF